MRRSLLDTDTVSYYLRGEPRVVQRAGAYIAAFSRLDIGAVTYYEVRRGLVHAGASRKLTQFETFSGLNRVWELDRRSAGEAADICTDLWRRGQPLDDRCTGHGGLSLAECLVPVLSLHRT